jgi:hypothetical protein
MRGERRAAGERRVLRLLLIGTLCGVAGALIWRRYAAPVGMAGQRAVEHEPPALDELTVDELRRIARELEIPGRSKMRKQHLIDAIDARRS